MRPSRIFFLPLVLLFTSVSSVTAAQQRGLPTVDGALRPPSYATSSGAGTEKEPSGKERAKLDGRYRRLRSAEAAHRVATEHFEKGLRARNKLAASRRHFAVALAHDARALRILERLLQSTADDECAKEVGPVLRSVKDQRLRAYLHIADLHRDKARELVQRGFRSTQLGASKRYMQAALSHQLRSLLLLARQLEGHVSDEPSKRIQKLASDVTDEAIQTHLHIAHLYTSRESYKRASQWVNAALALDPNHPRALADRARIELAISNSGR